MQSLCCSTFQSLCTCILMLKQMKILKNVEQKLSGNSLEKLRKSLAKNPDLKKLTENTDYDFKFKTRYAPLVSVELERSFSKYKDILSEKHNMTLKTIEHMNIMF